MSKSISCIVIALGLIVPTAALAGQSAMRQIAVHYDDLNLSQNADARMLIARIETASRSVCGGEPDMRDLKMRDFFRRCVKDTMDQAVASVHSPMVVAVYNGTPMPGAVEVSRR